MLDYDGTLAPFHEDRMKAVLYPGVEERIITLSSLAGVHMVVVTGRSARELRALLPSGVKADIWGSHGREVSKSDSSYRLFALNPLQQATLDCVIQDMTAAGLRQTLEIKPTSLAVHWRTCDAALQVHIRSRVQSIFSAAPGKDEMHLLPFDGGVELRSSDRNKGTAVREILSQARHGVPAAYLGDDLTDEDAFAALGDQDLPVLVRPEVRPSHARFWLRPPGYLLAFLDAWISASPDPRHTETLTEEASQ